MEPRPKAKPTPDLDLDSLSKSTAKHAQAKSLDLSTLSKSQAQAKSLDLSALSKSQSQARSLDLAALSAGPAKGHAKSHALDLAALATAPAGHRASASKASSLSAAMQANAAGALAAKIEGYWHPICDAPGAKGVIVAIHFRLNAANALVGSPTVTTQNTADADPSVVEAAAERARVAVEQASPFTELPKDFPKDVKPTFKAKEACGG